MLNIVSTEPTPKFWQLKNSLRGMLNIVSTEQFFKILLCKQGLRGMLNIVSTEQTLGTSVKTIVCEVC